MLQFNSFQFSLFKKGTVQINKTHDNTWVKNARISQKAIFHLQSPGNENTIKQDKNHNINRTEPHSTKQGITEQTEELTKVKQQNTKYKAPAKK